MRMRFVLGLALLSAVGCGGSSYRFAPVSGKITLDGKPLAGASVNFQPIAVGSETGPGSAGKTNEKGEYTLTSSKGKNGAQVGKHQVSISLLNAQVGDRDERPPRGGWPLADKLPAKYNVNSELSFVVPPGGSDQANFDLN